jgi:hypothetical protein
MKHTPAPWTIQSFPRSVTVIAEGVALAFVYPRASSPASGARYHEREANARLIAAAPELLAALKTLFDDYKRLADSGDCGFWKLEDQSSGQQALAAIAKAEGQS